jgi:hypothetical protein
MYSGECVFLYSSCFFLLVFPLILLDAPLCGSYASFWGSWFGVVFVVLWFILFLFFLCSWFCGIVSTDRICLFQLMNTQHNKATSETFVKCLSVAAYSMYLQLFSIAGGRLCIHNLKVVDVVTRDPPNMVHFPIHN